MRVLKYIFLSVFLFTSGISFAQTYNNTGTANLQRAPTPKGYIYRNNMGALGNVNWYTAAQLDSLFGLLPPPGAALLKANNLSDVNNAATSLANINGVSLLGSYANPPWITSLAWGKISGTPTTLGGYGITDGITTTTFNTTTGTSTLSLINLRKLNSDTLAQHGYVPQWQLANQLATNKSITTTISGLRAITSPQSAVLYQTTDFGGGNWFWNATDTRTDNTGTIIKATSVTTGRFNRIYSEKINIVWFGADTTHTNLSDVGIKAAIDWAGSLGGGHILFPSGIYKTTSVINQPYSNVYLEGDGSPTIQPVFTTDSSILIGRIRINIQTDYNEANKRISNVGVSGITIDDSLLPGIMPYSLILNPLPLYYGFITGDISVAGVDGVDIHDVNFKNSKDGGINLLMDYNVNLYNDHIEGINSVMYSDPVTHVKLLYNGNGFTGRGAVFYGSPVSPYTGPIGNYTITDCTVNGTKSTFPSPLYSGTNLTTKGNIGFMFGTGAFNAQGNTPNSFIMKGCTASNLTWGAMVEGELSGSSYVQILGNHFHDDLFGVALYGEIANQNWVKGNIVEDNEFTRIYFTPIEAHGNTSIIHHNIITDWNIAKKTTPNISNVLAIDGIGAAIYYSPFAVGDNTSTQNANGTLIEGNIAINNYTPDTSYLVPLAGIYGTIKSSGQTDNNTKIIGNFLKGGNSTNNPTNSNLASGIYISGKFRHINVLNNTVVGFPKYAFAADPVGSVQTNSPSDVTVAGNDFHDNGWKQLTNIMHVSSDNFHYDFHDNKLYETNGSRMSSALVIESGTSGASAMDSLAFKNNKVWGLAFGNTDYLAINTTGTKVYIENNDGYNYRTAIPTTTTYKSYKGTIIYNTDPTTGIDHWTCTVSGAPGTWVASYNKTGSDAVYAPISVVGSVTSVTSANTDIGVATGTTTPVLTFNRSLTLVAPALGTPTSGVATNLTGLPLTTGVTGILPIANGGTGSGTQPFVDISTNQTGLAGNKTWTGIHTYSPATTGNTFAWNLTPTQTANGNNQVLTALTIAPAFVNGAFTGIIHEAIRVNFGGVDLAVTDAINTGTVSLHATTTATSANYFIASDGTNLKLNAPSSSGNINLRIGNSNVGQIFPTSFNWVLGTGGLTDNGVDRLQVGGTILGTGLKSSGFAGGKALVSSGTSVTESTTTSTQIGYLSTTTSDVQTQLNSKGSGTVTSITPGYGFTSSTPITTTGTLTIDTTKLTTRLNLTPLVAAYGDGRYVQLSGGNLNSGAQLNINNGAIANFGSNQTTAPSSYWTSAGLKIGTTGNLTHNYTSYNNNNISTDNGTTAFTINIPQNTSGTFALTSQLTSGTVTSVTSANTDIGVATGTTTPVLTFNRGGTYTWTGVNTFNNSTVFGSGATFNSAITMNQQIVHNSGYQDIYYNSANTFNTVFGVNTLTANRTATLPDKDGTLVVSTQLPIHGNSTTTGTATTVVTVTIGTTMANTTYNTTITPRDLLTAVNYYISAQTTTTFDVTFISALTGSINFDYCVTP